MTPTRVRSVMESLTSLLSMERPALSGISVPRSGPPSCNVEAHSTQMCTAQARANGRLAVAANTPASVSWMTRRPELAGRGRSAALKSRALATQWRGRIMKIAGSSALVTGGASGLGGATARRLAEAGTPVVIADLNKEAGTALANALGEKARFVETDVTSEESMQQALEVAAGQPGGLRILVN